MAVQKVTLNVETNRPLSSYGNSHLIVYDAVKHNYYVITREAFLKPQNDKISVLENKFRELNDEYVKTVNALRNDYGNFQEEYKQKYNEFLKIYKETNAKMINMIKSLNEGESGK